MSEWNAETADWYAKKYGDYPSNKLGINELEILDNSTIIDIGCGTGEALRHASGKITGGKFIGIDPVPRMIEIANEWTENHDAREQIEYHLGSAENLPVEDGIADYILAFDSIDHWQDIEKGLIEVKRIMQPTGVFAIVKDKSVPGASQAIETLTGELESVGFTVKDKKEISKQEIEFYLVICQLDL
ncbi:MAG: class I SAM-dependent methyltransferase [Chloroflexi bacterium]|nr:class I SAM-dependent methyltransferase [Chloroflexota bacterium]